MSDNSPRGLVPPSVKELRAASEQSEGSPIQELIWFPQAYYAVVDGRVHFVQTREQQARFPTFDCEAEARAAEAAQSERLRAFRAEWGIDEYGKPR